MVTDPISDMIIQLKNAAMVGKRSVALPHSKIKMEIANILKREGYLVDISRRGKKATKTITMELAFDASGRAKIHEVKRISKPSRRVYQGFKDIRVVRQGTGVSILSTPKGLLTDRDAKKEKVGGELLFAIW